MNKHSNLGSSIGDLSRDIGISKDTLRVWERRYGFPQPVRNAQGQRFYPAEQQNRLRAICRLLDQGYRPGKVITLPLEQLNLLSRQLEQNTSRTDTVLIEQLLAAFNSNQPSKLNYILQDRFNQQGARSFVMDTVAPLLAQVGEYWANDQLPIYIERLITQKIKTILNRACGAIELSDDPLVVLLTTVPGEKHDMGLSMAELLLRLEGFDTLNLGVENPIDQIIQACTDMRPHALALSFSSIQKRSTVVSALTELSTKIPGTVLLLAGGKGVEKLRSLPARVKVVKKLDQLQASLHSKAKADITESDMDPLPLFI
jgi:DNA-binding transcriptional MerR regulator/methylmalonyl-CoA mutase cobalamin-binding subunit